MVRGTGGWLHWPLMTTGSPVARRQPAWITDLTKFPLPLALCAAPRVQAGPGLDADLLPEALRLAPNLRVARINASSHAVSAPCARGLAVRAAP